MSPTSQKNAHIDVREVSKTYGDLLVIDAVDLKAYSQEFLCIVGPSGCGKTTLLKILHGLVTPTAGEVHIGGSLVSQPSRDRAVVFQQANLMPWRTVVRNVTFGLEVAGVRRSDAQARAEHFLELVGLAEFDHYYPHELSGGMQQRVNLARALAVEPSVLLMDEPFAALDAQTRDVMQEEILRINTMTSATIVFITHQIDEALLLGDRVAVMDARPGRFVEIVDVPFGRDRSLETRRTPEFAQLSQHIWTLLESTARRQATQQ